MAELSRKGRACVLAVLEIRQRREEEANYFATVFFGAGDEAADGPLAKFPMDLARLVIMLLPIIS